METGPMLVVDGTGQDIVPQQSDLALEEYRCPICFCLPMLQPCRLKGCAARHVFCYTCIKMWFESCGATGTCPIDRRCVPAEEVLEPDSDLEAGMRKLIISCPNGRLGCDAVLPLEEHAAHLTRCAYRTIDCPRCKQPTPAASLKVRVTCVHCFKCPASCFHVAFRAA